jgi:hypothetical protein
VTVLTLASSRERRELAGLDEALKRHPARGTAPLVPPKALRLVTRDERSKGEQP